MNGRTDGWLVVLGFNATLTANVISWRSVTHVFPGFLTPVLTQLFFPKSPTTFLTCFCRGQRRKYATDRRTTARSQLFPLSTSYSGKLKTSRQRINAGNQHFLSFIHDGFYHKIEQEGHDGPVSLHWLIREIHSNQTLHYLGIGLKHKTPYKD